MCASTQTDDMEITTILYCYGKLSADLKLKILSKLFTSYMLSNCSLLVPDDFLSYAAEAMTKLKSSERTNVLYNLAKGIGKPRADNNSKFPTDHMSMGLVECTASFYSDDLQKVFCVRKCHLLCHAILFHRYHVLLIIVCGSKQCTVFTIWAKVVKVTKWTNVECRM